MKKSSLGTIVSIIFMLATVGVLYYFWNSAENAPVATTDTSAQTYIPVDISGAKSQASKLLSGCVNNANVPIPTPTAKLGKANPFNDPE